MRGEYWQILPIADKVRRKGIIYICHYPFYKIPRDNLKVKTESFGFSAQNAKSLSDFCGEHP